MILIVYANVIISALIKEDKTRGLLIDCPFTLYCPETLISSIRKYEEIIIKKSMLSKEEFEILFSLITEKISVVEKDKYVLNMEKAEEIIGSFDKDDAPYIALALSLTNDGVWSDDFHFKKQNLIKIFTTTEIINYTLGI
ncbi:MAG: PIN domain-containing protein [Nanoarchaeota archaeon]